MARFLKSMIAQGCFIPNRESIAEIEDDFADQLAENREKKCQMGDACKVEEGVDYNEDGGIKEIILCDQCGAFGCHIACDEQLMKYNALHEAGEEQKFPFVCNVCLDILNKPDNEETEDSPRGNEVQDDKADSREVDDEDLSDSLQKVEVKSQESQEDIEKIESKVAGRKRKASEETDKPNKKMKSGSPQVWFHISENRLRFESNLNLLKS